MNISQSFSPVKRFFQENLRTESDFDVSKGRQEAQRVDSELERIHTDTVDVKGQLENLEQDSALKPPSFQDVSDKDVMLATTAGGAVLGGAVGTLKAMTAGPATAEIRETVHDITQPALRGTGFDISVFEVGPSTGAPDGWDVDITRRPLTTEKVGEYTSREAVGTNTSSIALSGALGIAAGAGIGAGVGLATLGLRRVLNKEYNGAAPRETENDNRVLLTMGGAGAVIGAGAGALSSVLQSNTVKFQTQTLPTPDTKVIGQVPSGPGYYVPNSGGHQAPANAEAVADIMKNGRQIDRLAREGYRGTENLRPEDVTAQVPARNLFGQVKVDTETREVNVGPSFVGSVVGGAAVGAVTGVAGGVLVNVLRKTL